MKVFCENFLTNVEILGEGEERILFLHGFGGKLASFLPVQIFLSKSAECINLDLWGMGDSDDADDLTILDYAIRIVQLLNHFGVEKTHIVAHSFGCRIALMLAYLYPEMVGKILITGGAGLKPKRNIIYYYRIYKFKFIRKFYPKLLKKRKYGSSEYCELTDGMKKTFKNAVNFDQTFMLKKIKHEVLLYHGEKDTATPLYMARTMRKKLKNSELIIKTNCGHFAYIENINEFCLVAKSFFNLA